MRLVSLNVGLPRSVEIERRLVRTAGQKDPVAAAWLGPEGFAGDAQADRRNHGGPDKAACVYAFDHYPHWEAALGRELAPGAFSENLTVAGLREPEVCVGDEFTLGGARVQISQPRYPCYKLAHRLGRPDLVDLILANGYSGFYLRVLAPGHVESGAALVLAARDPAGVSVEFANRVMYRQQSDRESLERVLAVPALSAAWREALSQRR